MGEAKRRPNRVQEAIERKEQEDKQVQEYQSANPPKPLSTRAGVALAMMTALSLSGMSRYPKSIL